MTVEADTVNLVSVYTVGETGDISLAAFEQYKAWAKIELDSLVPASIDSAMYDRLHALLIADMHESKNGDRLRMKSEKIGDYSYTVEEAGKTTYRALFEKLLAMLEKGEQPAGSVLRNDVAGEGFKLDQNEFVGF